uniref:Regulator of chromosome condensation protein n=1 Tax=Marseillevirus LCMAC201 TaxID=2506605 RepID=A0A481YVA0_9VIRU|nr:MAG: regulator of chromosome condensation protein [Marseillevirus LCMAC201]
MFPYQRSIQICIKDLLTYPNQQLLLLAAVMDIPLNQNRHRLAEDIATRLIDQNWPLHKAHMLEAELPYAGNIHAAVQARDTNAIRKIQAWRKAGEKERSKQLVKEEEKKVVPPQAKECSNEKDFITQEDWDADNLPQVKIKLLNKDDPINGPSYTLCFMRDTLKVWLDDPKHKLAVWLPNKRGGDMDDNGHGLPGSEGAGPSANTIYIQLPNGITYVERAELLLDPNYNDFIGVPIATDVRLGNRAGTFGQSELHGQAPGKVIYLIVTAQGDLHDDLEDYLWIILAERNLIEVLDIYHSLNSIETMTNKDIIKMLQRLINLVPVGDKEYNCLKIASVVSGSDSQDIEWPWEPPVEEVEEIAAPTAEPTAAPAAPAEPTAEPTAAPTAAPAENGEIWGCGYNGAGQLGLDDEVNRKVLTQIPNIKAKSVAGGDNHTIVIDLENNVWVCGRNYAGQLGLDDQVNRKVLTQIPNIKAKSVACGANYTIVIDLEDKLWASG